MLLVRCPRCGHDQKYWPKVAITRAKKRCVYCGHTFLVHASLPKNRIIEVM
jgi:hypothetical protein